MSRIINRWIIFTAVLALVSGFFLWKNRDAQSNAEYYRGCNTVKLCEYIELNLLKNDVELIPYDGTVIKFEYTSIVPVEVLLGDNKLVVNESDEVRVSFLTDDNTDFVFRLYLPRHVYRSIIVYTSTGSVTLDSITSSAISVVTKSGDIASSGTCSLTSLISGSGDIFMDFSEVVADCRIETRRGDAEIRFPEGSSVALSYETDTGSFRSELLSGSVRGSYMYSFNGGEDLIHADIESGLLTVSQKDVNQR